MKKLLVIAFLFGSFLQAQEAVPEKPEMFTRQYFFRQPRWTSITQNAGGNPFGGDGPELPWARKTAGPEAMQEFFSRLYGIDFPEGSWIRHQMIGYNFVITMHNTETNHARFRYNLILEGTIPVNIHLNLRLVAFDAAQIDALERKQPAELNDQALLDLWRKGEGKTLSSQSIKTFPGVNAIIEMADEIIYPAEIKTVTEEEKKTESTGFETRNAGNSLNITPTLNPDLQSVTVVVLPGFITYKGLNPDMDADKKSFSPLFESLNTSTSLLVPNQGTRVLGQSTSLDGTRQLVLFLSAGIQEADGSLLSVQAPVAPPDE